MTRRLLITVIVTVTLLLAAIVLYRYSYEKLRAYDASVEHTQEVIINFSELNNLLKSLKIYSRNYNIYNERQLLDRYIQAKIDVQRRHARLAQLANDNNDQTQRLDTLNVMLADFLKLTDAQMGASGPQRPDSLNYATILMMVQKAEPLMERGIAAEKQLLRQRQQSMNAWGSWLNVWVAVFIGAALLLLILSIASNYDQFRRRQSAEDFLQSILNTTRNGVIAYSVVLNDDAEVVDLKVMFANRGIVNQLGLEPNDVIGKTYFELWPSAPRTGAFEHFLNVYRSGIPEEFETKSIEAKTDRWYHVSAARMQDGVTVTFNDITAIKRYESQLQQKIEELVRTNSELEQFAYVSSHDLQEPLRKIEMYSTLTDQRHSSEMPDEANAYLKKIMHSSQRMRNLINDLLNYSRVSREQEPFVPTNLNDILTNVVTDFELMIEEKNALVTIGAMPVLEVVPLQINQLFQNLMSNSLKFSSPERTPKIEVFAEPVNLNPSTTGEQADDSNAAYEIIWRDNGIGFDPQFTDKIFTIFQRLHTRDEYEGTGIGLALCKRIVANHGGHIQAEPVGDGGVTFRIVLPVKQHVINETEVLPE